MGFFCLILLVVYVGVFLVVVVVFAVVGFFLILFLACDPVCCDMKIISPGRG